MKVISSFYNYQKYTPVFKSADSRYRSIYTPSKAFAMPDAVPEKIVLPPNIPHSLKYGEIYLINRAREEAASSLEQNSRKYLPFISDSAIAGADIELLMNLCGALFKSGISGSTRHIPPPFNFEVLKKTAFDYFKTSDIETVISKLKELHKQDRGRFDAAAEELSGTYARNLINYQLHKIFTDENYSKINVYNSDGIMLEKNKQTYDSLPDEKGLWIKIPSRKNDKKHPGQNISVLESLSSANWCTRSRFYKADNALRCGDFYIYLENKNGSFSPEIGMVTENEMISQIQGVQNNGYIPEQYIDLIQNFINANNLPLSEEYSDEGNPAAVQLALGAKMNESINGISLKEALEKKDKEILRMLLLEGGSFEGKNQDSIINAGQKSYPLKLIDFGLTDIDIAALNN